MPYDSYRPGMDNRVSAFDGNEDSMFWRRDERDERRGRRPSEGAPQSHSRQTPSPRRSSRSRSPQMRSHRNNSVSTRFANSDHPDQLQNRSRRSSDVTSHTQRRPSISFSLPSRSPVHEHQSFRTIMSPHSVTAESQRARSTDPRLRVRTQNNVPSFDAAPSPAASSTDDNLDVKDQAIIMKELTRVFYSSNELKKEQDALKKKHTHLTGELEKALRMFPRPNPYTEKIREEVHTIELALKAKTSAMNKIKKQEESALRASATFQRNDNTVLTELQSLRAKFAAEESRASELKESNESLQQQVARLVSTVNELQAQFKQQQDVTSQSNFQEQIDAIRNRENSVTSLRQDEQIIVDLKNDVKKLQEETLENLRSDVQQQKLGMARLNDVFVSQDSFNKLSANLDTLNEHVSSAPKPAQTHPGGHITRDDLQAYISTFNKFQDKIEVRLDNIENSKWLTDDDLASYAKISDLNHQVQSLKTTYNETTTQLQAKSDSAIKGVADANMRSSKLERDMHMSSEARKALVGRVDAVEGIQQTLRLQGLSGFPRADGQQLQRDIAAIQGGIHAQTNVSNALSHSVKSLNTRFNNLTSEHLARQMMGIIEPMLTTVKPQMTTMTTQVQELRSAHDQFKSTQSIIANRMVDHDQRIRGLHAGVETLHQVSKNQVTKVSGLVEEITTLSTNTKQTDLSHEENVRSIRKSIDDIRDLQAESLKDMDKAVQTKTGILRDYVNAENEKGLQSSKKHIESALEFAKTEQQVSFDGLLQQVKEARDGLDGRLTVIENAFSRPQDNIATVEKADTVIVDLAATTDQHVGKNTDTAQPTQHVIRGVSAESSPSKSKGPSKRKMKTKSSASKSAQPSPLSRHFVPRPDFDDTIDITPKPRIDVPRRSDGPNVISLLDSDQDTDEADDVGHYVFSMREKGIDYEMWGVKDAANKGSVKDKHNAIPASQNTDAGDSTPSVKSSQSKRKRKRELARIHNASKGGANGSSQPSTPGLGGQEKKRTKL